MLTSQCNPLTDEHCQVLSGVLESCSLQDELISHCQQAGLNVDQYVKENRRNKEMALGLKQAFFPDRP